MLWVRATVAAFVAQTVDTLIFVTIAFYGKFALLPVIGGQLAAKALIWGLAIPLLYLARAGIHRYLGMERAAELREQASHG